MTDRDFVYWLKGFAELHGETPTDQQWIEIMEHLDKCFNYEIQPTRIEYNKNFPNWVGVEYLPAHSC